MALKRLAELGKMAKGLKGAHSLLEASKREKEALNECIRKIEEKRAKAMGKFKNDKRDRATIHSWSEDDMYADDNFYRRRLEECYRMHRKLERAMGIP